MRSLRVVGVATLLAAGSFSGCSDDPATGMAPMLGAGTGVPTAGAGVAGAAAGTGATGTAGSTVVGTAGSSVGAAGRAGAGAAGTGAAGSSVAGAAAGSGAAGSGAAGSSAAGSSAAGSSAAGSAAAGSGGAAGAVAPTVGKSPCLKKASQVVFIGDSYINYDIAHTALNTLIERNAVKDMRLQASDRYRSYAIPGTALAAPNLLGMIPPQWDQAVAEDSDIKYVIMDGGGNDVLIDNMQCLAAGADMDAGCQAVVADTLRVGTELINKMKSAGVTDVIYFFYPHVPTGGDDINDYSLTMLQASAKSLASDTFHTFVIDTIPMFEGHEDWFATDGIHANEVGEQALADGIWKLMKDNCIAQPASANCGCTP